MNETETPSQDVRVTANGCTVTTLTHPSGWVVRIYKQAGATVNKVSATRPDGKETRNREKVVDDQIPAVIAQLVGAEPVVTPKAPPIDMMAVISAEIAAKKAS